MGDNIFRCKQPFFDKRQQLSQPGMDVGLPHLKAQPFIEGIAKQEAVYKTGIHARHADHASAPHRSNALAQGFAAAAFNFQVTEDRFRGAAFGLKPDGINHRIHSALSGRLLNDFLRRVVIVIKVNRDRAVALLGKPQSIGMMVNHKNLLCAEKPRAGNGQ